MNEFTCLIVEDEPFAMEIIESYVAKIPYLKSVASCASAFEAAAVLQKENIDILITDIQMPQINGIELIKSLSNPPLVIITTAHPDYAVEGFDLGVIDYLLKPIAFDRFFKAINKAKEVLENKNKKPETVNKNHYFIKDGYKLTKILFDDILYVEGLKDFIKIVTKEKNYVIYMRMKDMEEILSKNLFYRVHKSYIINTAKIKHLMGNMVEMSDAQQITVAQSNRDGLIKMLGIKG